MSLRYKTMNDLQKQFSEAEILMMVSRYLDDREARADYHKKYNAKKNAMVKAINSDPELKRRAMEMVNGR